MGHLQRTEELTNKFKRFLDFDPQAKKRKNKKHNLANGTIFLILEYHLHFPWNILRTV